MSNEWILPKRALPRLYFTPWQTMKLWSRWESNPCPIYSDTMFLFKGLGQDL